MANVINLVFETFEAFPGVSNFVFLVLFFWGGGGGVLFEAAHQSSSKAQYGFGYPKTTVPRKQL